MASPLRSRSASRPARAARAAAAGVLAAGLLAPAGCGGGPPEPLSYRLARSGERWEAVGRHPVLDDLTGAYPEFFRVILDPRKAYLPDLRPLRDDLEKAPADLHSYDALNALAIAYFELNHRAQSDRGGGSYFADSTRAAKLVAVPWRTYGEIEDPALRDAILDFFADIARGEKADSASTAPRLVRTVESLARKESDPERLARIREIAARLASHGPPAY